MRVARDSSRSAASADTLLPLSAVRIDREFSFLSFCENSQVI